MNSTNITVDSSLIVNVHPRNFTVLGESVDPQAGFAVCTYLTNDYC